MYADYDRNSACKVTENSTSLTQCEDCFSRNISSGQWKRWCHCKDPAPPQGIILCLQNLLIRTRKVKVWFNTTLVSLQNIFHQRVAERCSRQRGFSPTISSFASTRDSRLTETRLIFIESLPMFDPLFECLPMFDPMFANV